MPRPSVIHVAMLAAGGLVAFAANDAHAYLLDTNDARVVDHGSFEAELQPIGYYQLVLGDVDHELIAPSLQMYLGIARDWDLLVLTRGFGLLEGDPGQSPYALADQMLAFRAMLRHGAYSSSDAEGPSLALQMGVLLPGVESDPGVGATVALLFAQKWDAGTLHMNAWVNLTRDRLFNVFLSAVVEGPPSWQVRPMVEVWIDLVLDGDPQLSGTIGAWADITSTFAVEGGVRIGGWEDWLDLEVRLAMWWHWDLFDPNPGAHDDEDESAQSSASSPRTRQRLMASR